MFCEILARLAKDPPNCPLVNGDSLGIQTQRIRCFDFNAVLVKTTHSRAHHDKIRLLCKTSPRPSPTRRGGKDVGNFFKLRDTCFLLWFVSNAVLVKTTHSTAHHDKIRSFVKPHPAPLILVDS